MSLTFKLSESPPLPSISAEQLNTELVKMRKLVNTSKLYIFRDLLNYIKKIQLKLSKSPDNERLKHKLEHRSSELMMLRGLSTVRICKLLLANETDKSELSKNGHKLTAQDRLIIRMSGTKVIANFVRSFREAHPDWPSLVHYLLYKNISGKWKSREQKRRNRKVRGSLPLPPAPAPANEDELVHEDTELPDSTTTAVYRIPTSNPPDFSNKSSPPHPLSPSHEEELDSDAASDIAEEVVNRIVTRRGLAFIQAPPNAPTVGSQDDTVGEVGPLVSSDYRRVDVCIKDPSSSSVGIPTSSKSRNGKQSVPEFVQHVKPSCAVDGTNHSPGKPPVLPDAMVSDDENPLGSDDVSVRAKLTAKSRCFRQSTLGNSRHRQLFGQGPAKPRAPRHPPVTSRTLPPGGKLKQLEAVELAAPGMHPSWQAKREQRLKVRQMSTTHSSIAKHIVFDED
ncbi:uncharacterized protein DEA37_0014022 [Paragonimus westermani]|uniref:Serum response factor-binding protein 1 n=1 Tax=Paragonimus westermani TaxID=34504 RepID=A0A5J4NY89_9TREM|nr:uncharacterized protein DEA37_0014022 [Paragonimus westermani]